MLTSNKPHSNAKRNGKNRSKNVGVELGKSLVVWERFWFGYLIVTSPFLLSQSLFWDMKVIIVHAHCTWKLYVRQRAKSEVISIRQVHWVCLFNFIYNFNLKMVLSVMSCPEKDYISEQFPYSGSQCYAILSPKCIQFWSDLRTFLWT